MEATGNMRDLDQIQERDDAGNTSRVMSLALGGIATACVLFAVGVMVGREAAVPPQPHREDPLARLDRLAVPQTPTSTYAERLVGHPSEGASITNPLTTPSSATPGHPAGQSAVTDSPRNTATDATPVLLPGQAPQPGSISLRLRPLGTTAPGATANNGTPRALAPEGIAGSYAVQVSSFHSLPHAQTYARTLRERGYRAYVTPPARAPNGAIWHRVRIGPFNTAQEAAAFRPDFEARERRQTFVVHRAPESTSVRD